MHVCIDDVRQLFQQFDEKSLFLVPTTTYSPLTKSLMSQRFDRVHAGGTLGGVDAEDQPDR